MIDFAAVGECFYPRILKLNMFTTPPSDSMLQRQILVQWRLLLDTHVFTFFSHQHFEKSLARPQHWIGGKGGFVSFLNCEIDFCMLSSMWSVKNIIIMRAKDFGMPFVVTFCVWRGAKEFSSDRSRQACSNEHLIAKNLPRYSRERASETFSEIGSAKHQLAWPSHGRKSLTRHPRQRL